MHRTIDRTGWHVPDGVCPLIEGLAAEAQPCGAPLAIDRGRAICAEGHPLVPCAGRPCCTPGAHAPFCNGWMADPRWDRGRANARRVAMGRTDLLPTVEPVPEVSMAAAEMLDTAMESAGEGDPLTPCPLCGRS